MRRDIERKILGLLVLACMLVATGCAIRFRPEPEATGLPDGGAILQTQLTGASFLVRARLNGRGPYRFILDTGTPALVVSPQVGEELPGSVKSCSHIFKDLDGNDFECPGVLLVDTLEAGGALFHDFHALILDLDVLSRFYGTRIDGILGLRVFAECLLVLDFPDSRVRVVEDALPPVDDREILDLSVRGGQPFLDLNLGPKRFSCMVDSGSDAWIVVPKSTKSLRFCSAPFPLFRSISLAGVKKRGMVARMADDCSFGRHTIEQPIVSFCEGRDHPILGAGVLENFEVTLDQVNGRARFRRSESGPIKVPAYRTTGIRYEKRGEAWHVLDLIPGGPGERAGLHLDDRIKTMEGRDVSGLDIDLLEEELGEKRGEITLVVKRRTERLKVVVPFVDLLAPPEKRTR